jgi:DTW domain-containing protein YfiP
LNNKQAQKVRESWTQKATNTAQVLNAILQDTQMRDWERRLKEVEVYRRRQSESIERFGSSEQTG